MVKRTVVPGVIVARIDGSRTTKGISMAAMYPGMASQEMTRERWALSSLSTTPLAGWSWARQMVVATNNARSAESVARFFMVQLRASLRCGDRLATEAIGLAIEFRVRGGKFFDGDELVFVDRGKMLTRV